MVYQQSGRSPDLPPLSSADLSRRGYFCTATFPPEADLSKVVKSKTYAKLVNYLRVLCNIQGVPVHCAGDGGYKNKRVFKCNCKEAHKDHEGRCNFSFKLCWDRIGYYIEIHDRGYGRDGGFHFCRNFTYNIQKAERLTEMDRDAKVREINRGMAPA